MVALICLRHQWLLELAPDGAGGASGPDPDKGEAADVRDGHWCGAQGGSPATGCMSRHIGNGYLASCFNEARVQSNGGDQSRDSRMYGWAGSRQWGSRQRVRWSLVRRARRVITKGNLVTFKGLNVVACTLHAVAILLKEGLVWDLFINLSVSDYPPQGGTVRSTRLLLLYSWLMFERLRVIL
jgi:hypothetical protein